MRENENYEDIVCECDEAKRGSEGEKWRNEETQDQLRRKLISCFHE